MSKRLFQFLLHGFYGMLLLMPTWAMAQNSWSNYRSVQTQPERVTPLRAPFENGLSSSSNSQNRYVPNGYAYRYHHNRYAKGWRGTDDDRQNGLTIVYRQDLLSRQDDRYERQVFVHGQTLPEPYRDARYRVDDWSRYQLEQPLYGRHWVRVDGSYLLVQDDHFVIELVR